MLKRALAALFAIFLVFGLVGCGGAKDEEPYEEIPAANIEDTDA